MSYSYIKSVFPNFENSNKVYDESLYITPSTTSTSNKPSSSNISNTPNKNKVMEEEKKYTSSNVVSDDYASFTLAKGGDQNNLQYGNIPLQFFKMPKTEGLVKSIERPLYQEREKFVETFENQPKELVLKESIGCDIIDCNLYMKHISECSKCKKIILKQFGIESDRIRNEEILELISYIIFGLFILLLIDYLKRNK
jgi:hypothetical protein